MYKEYIKKVLDKLLSFVFIIILIPFYLIVSALIIIIDRNSVIYKQNRTGLNGRTFQIYKFRTFKNGNTTKLGIVLRSLSLDEIPQFFNILRGDMSIVGPRPWVPEYYENMTKKQRQRTRVLPGLVGLAQVNGRKDLSIFDKINYDLQYVNNISFLLDLKICIKALTTIIKIDNSKINYVDMEVNQLKENVKKQRCKMNLEVLLSTVNLNKKDLYKMNITSNCTVINQCNKTDYTKYKNFNIYSYNEKGLSISRNRGLAHVSGDIILLCDDDVIYNNDYEKLVISAFENNKNADIITFNLDSPYRKIKPNNKNKRLHIYNSLRYNSSSIAFKKDSILKNNITFNKLFGSNSVYTSGEDTLFIVDSLKKGLKLYSNTSNIGTIYHKKSLWFKGYNKKYFFDKGALFTAISYRFRRVLMIQYLLRHKEVLENMNFKQAYKEMKKGSIDYIERYLK